MNSGTIYNIAIGSYMSSGVALGGSCIFYMGSCTFYPICCHINNFSCPLYFIKIWWKSYIFPKIHLFFSDFYVTVQKSRLLDHVILLYATVLGMALMRICKEAFWQDNCPSERTFYQFLHCAGRIALFLQNVWVKLISHDAFQETKTFFS